MVFIGVVKTNVKQGLYFNTLTIDDLYIKKLQQLQTFITFLNEFYKLVNLLFFSIVYLILFVVVVVVVICHGDMRKIKIILLSIVYSFFILYNQ